MKKSQISLINPITPNNQNFQWKKSKANRAKKWLPISTKKSKLRGSKITVEE